jgi:hypothetical protein
MADLKRTMTARATAQLRAANAAAAATAAAKMQAQQQQREQQRVDGDDGGSGCGIGGRGGIGGGSGGGGGGGGSVPFVAKAGTGGGDPSDVLSEIRRLSPHLRDAEEEAVAHGPALDALRAELEALDGTASPAAIAALRSRAEAALDPITDEPRMLARLKIPAIRMECLRAAATNRVGPGRCCSPHHWLPFNVKYELSKCNG